MLMLGVGLSTVRKIIRLGTLDLLLMLVAIGVRGKALDELTCLILRSV